VGCHGSCAKFLSEQSRPKAKHIFLDMHFQLTLRIFCGEDMSNGVTGFTTSKNLIENHCEVLARLRPVPELARMKYGAQIVVSNQSL
jgi:hypothetical protein